VFFPVIAKEIGYAIDGDKGTIKKIEKWCLVYSYYSVSA
jgi:hypothetical protein